MATKTNRKESQPEKPYPEFPLRPHARGKWTKKIGGQSFYFGAWADPYGALAEYEAYLCKDETKTARKASASETGIYDAAMLFLDSQLAKVDEGSLQKRTYSDYLTTCKRFADRIGRNRAIGSLQPSDFGGYRQHLTTTLRWGTTTTGNEVVRVRTFLRWYHETYLPATVPMFGPDFKRPGRISLRKHRAESKSKLLKPEVIHAVLAESGVHFRAMIHLGINAAFGVTDCARVPLTVISNAIETGWLCWPRAKTWVQRECALWPETIEALQQSMAIRGNHKLAEFFVAPDGRSFDKDGKSYLIPGRWKAAKKSAQIQDGSFACLRHTFNTIARQTGDEGAVKMVMGHVDGTISEIYDHAIGERFIEDERHIRIQMKVRSWLGFGNRPASINPFVLSPLFAH